MKASNTSTKSLTWSLEVRAFPAPPLSQNSRWIFPGEANAGCSLRTTLDLGCKVQVEAQFLGFNPGSATFSFVILGMSLHVPGAHFPMG